MILKGTVYIVCITNIVNHILCYESTVELISGSLGNRMSVLFSKVPEISNHGARK